ncbi:MAG: hypothetical protein RL441_419 [Actinomycetota bacterium]|jgi:hypothetical protein
MSEPQVPQATYKASSREIGARSNLFVQAFRFLVINLKMIKMIRKGHH